MPLSQRHHPVDFPPCPAGLCTWTPELGLETSGQARSLEISQLRTCACSGLCKLRQWLESLMMPEPAKKLVLWGWHAVQLAKLERKMDQMMLHSTVSLWFCVCCCSEGQTSFWPSHRDGSGSWFLGLDSAQRLFLISGYGSSPPVPGCSCCCFILCYKTYYYCWFIIT